MIYQEMSSGILDLLRKSLRPEFLNRIDEMIVFRSLSLENLRISWIYSLRRSIKDWLNRR